MRRADGMRRDDLWSERRRDLSDAVAAGVIDEPTAGKLARFLETREGARPVEDEPVRLVTGFNDVFVLLGFLLSLAGVIWVFDKMWWIAVPAMAWGLSEIFARRRRMALPSIALALAFLSPALIYATISPLGLMTPRTFISPEAGLVVAAMAGLYFWRFRVPVAAAASAVALTFATVSLIAGLSGGEVSGLLWFLAGLALFAVAMTRDMRDPERVTLDADIAFWLHLAASPMIVHAVIGGLGWRMEGSAPSVQAMFWPAVAAIWIVGVVIDRRPLIVSSISYVVAAITLAGAQSRTSGIAFALLVAGAAILALSVWWRPIRRAALSLLPLGALRSRLPPVDGP